MKIAGIKPKRRFIEHLKCLEAGALAATYDQDISEMIHG